MSKDIDVLHDLSTEKASQKSEGQVMRLSLLF